MNHEIVWQHPYVDVFKQSKAMLIEPQHEGDIKKVMDKSIRKQIYRVRGNVAASNYIQYPRYVHFGNSKSKCIVLASMNQYRSASTASGRGLGLTGRFIYLEVIITFLIIFWDVVNFIPTLSLLLLVETHGKKIHYHSSRSTLGIEIGISHYTQLHLYFNQKFGDDVENTVKVSGV